MSTFKDLWISPLTSVLLLASTGCASVVGTAGIATTIIESRPPGAAVWFNGTQVGTTPHVYTHDPVNGTELKFELRKDGYANTTTTLLARRNNSILFADAMLFHVPYLFDKDHPNLYSLSAAQVVVDLFKASPGDLDKFELLIAGVEVKTGERAPAGRYNKHEITTGNVDVCPVLGRPEQLGSDLVLALRGSWADARWVTRGTPRGEEAMQRAKFYLLPALLSVQADLTGSRYACNGAMSVEVDWRFYSSLRQDSIAYSVRTTTTYNAIGERAADLISKAMGLGARRMLEEEGLYERLRDLRAAAVMLSKGDMVPMSTPKAIAFTGRKDMLSELLKAVATVETSEGHGSGFLISNDGYIITNEHVVGPEKSVKVRFSQGFTLSAEVVKVNKDFDLALLKAQVDEMPALTMGADSALLVGEEIFAIGTPLDKELGQTVSRGILSGKREFEGRHYLQTDVSINPGNSGGPLIDETGRVVGVATMKLSGKGLEGLGFGVPISAAIEMLNIQFGR